MRTTRPHSPAPTRPGPTHTAPTPPGPHSPAPTPPGPHSPAPTRPRSLSRTHRLRSRSPSSPAAAPVTPLPAPGRAVGCTVYGPTTLFFLHRTTWVHVNFATAGSRLDTQGAASMYRYGNRVRGCLLSSGSNKRPREHTNKRPGRPLRTQARASGGRGGERWGRWMTRAVQRRVAGAVLSNLRVRTHAHTHTRTHTRAHTHTQPTSQPQYAPRPTPCLPAGGPLQLPGCQMGRLC